MVVDVLLVVEIIQITTVRCQNICKANPFPAETPKLGIQVQQRLLQVLSAECTSFPLTRLTISHLQLLYLIHMFGLFGESGMRKDLNKKLSTKLVGKNKNERELEKNENLISKL